MIFGFTKTFTLFSPRLLTVETGIVNRAVSLAANAGILNRFSSVFLERLFKTA